MKASAPRREPAPLTDGDFAPAEQIRSAQSTSAGAIDQGDVASGTPLAPASGTAGGGIDLDAVLARRRASGE
ncbi:hypothetical protein GALL_257320 [mine drainage metagenome]|uniref:Uncharacterized protein n=1 Tax=mine drainage metagenome TaxID=410659 RepID=A0A1J5RW64_9ZZZZ